ncbi:hypothetical protein CF326_g6371 [Tilletia indica]|uniref:Uncharacterized protein n=1 Tax=Tilletia indica TaxID=43049 RepID=A0A177T6J6_9BASI|nr:hypothetical protein CF326_g6371 [Tilletia indica]KAE8241102.1 hypothetical protein A4X13_0g7561 [Tilletia indica]
MTSTQVFTTAAADAGSTVMASQTTQTAEHIQPISSISAVQALSGTAGPSSSTPTRSYQAQTEDVRLQKLVAVEKQFVLTPSETATMSIEDRFERIKSLKEEQKGLADATGATQERAGPGKKFR